jgi:peptide subunit release factor 1 (eRF1)
MQAEKALARTSLDPLIKTLAAFEPSEFPVISLYLNAQADERGRDNFLGWLKNELSERVKEYAEDSPEEKSLKQDIEKINEFANSIRSDANGVAIFACSGANGFFETAQFATSIEQNEILISDRPYIFPMARLIEQNPRYVVAWADTNAARIYLFGGELAVNAETETEAQVEEIQNVKTQRQQQGGWSQMRFQRRIENFHVQHAKEVAETLDKLVRDEEIETVVLSGDAARAIHFLRDEMPKALADKVIEEMSLDQYASEKDFQEESLKAVRRYDAQKDIEEVARLMDEVGANNLGVIGVSATLAALSNGQVQELLILSDPEKIRYNEQRVEKILEDYAPGDDNSANDALPNTSERQQVLDELLVRAINSAARIRFIEDATLLMSVGGVGAILRYKI